MSLVVLVTACNDDDDGEKNVVNQRDFSIADYLMAGSGTQSSNYNTLFVALEKAGLLSTLESGSFTLLAPTDAAFAAAGIDIDDMEAADLATVLNYHLLASEVDAEGLSGRIATVNGATFSAAGGVINGVATATQEISLTNGIVFGLDAVLTPPVGNLSAVLAADANLSLAAAAFAKSSISLTGASNLTVFAPDNDAMTAAGLDQAGIDAATQADIDATLEYHIVAGDNFSSSLSDGEIASTAGTLAEVPGLEITTGDPLEVSGSNVTSGNVPASNGVVHVIDGVLSPPTTVADAMGPSVDVNFGFDGLILDGLYGGIVRLGLEATYFGDVSKEVTVIGPCCGAFSEASFPDDADLQAAIEAHIFDGLIDPLTAGTEGGTRITSIGGDEYVLTTSDNGSFINGSFGNAFVGGGFTATVHNGVLSNVVGILSGLPTDNITTVLDADADYTLFSAALKVVASDIGTADYTILAVDNTTWTAAFGTDLDEVAEIAAASADDLAGVLNHVIPNWYFGVDIDDGTLPVFSAASGNDLTLVMDADGDISVQIDPTDYTSVVKITSSDDFTASNGVVHTVDGVISL
ncbi:MAG: fasciclin domain-containing protein [Bacteroidota bacterium]